MLFRSPLSCDVNPFVSCSDVMATWQAHLLGFPNPLIGVMGFVAPIAVGAMLLSGGVIRSRAFWTTFNVGVFLAWLLVTWFFTQAVFAIGKLCPWCMLAWSATIPMFWVFTAWNMRYGGLPFGDRGRRIGAAVLPYAWIIVLVNYLVIIVTILIVFPQLLRMLF